MMGSLEASEQKANCGEAINSLAFQVSVRIWILPTKGNSSTQIIYEWQYHCFQLGFLCTCNSQLGIASFLFLNHI